MRYVVGFTQAPGQVPFHVYESESAPNFLPGSKILASPPGLDARWMQVNALAYQIQPDAVVTTVVVGEGTNIGGDGEDFVAWPW